jgi:3-methyladenine DNA glycosylase AlkD
MTDPALPWARDVVSRTVQALTALADPGRAPAMAAYLRDQFPFLGIGKPLRMTALRAAWHELPAPAPAELTEAVRALWTLPEREYQYAGCDLLGRWGRLLGPDFLDDTGRELITSRSWWDTVDSLRTVAVGPLVLAHAELVPMVVSWVDSDNRWLVRSAIIHQLTYGERTDEQRLFALCARRAADPEFFIAKAIGWALRTHARRAPDTVRAFLAGHPELTPLARREAAKHLR